MEGASFEAFAVGPGNRLAVAAVRRAAEAPGASYNPLLVVGPAGSGKGHLLAAAADLARRVRPGISVRLEGADAFTERLTASIAAGRVEELHSAYASLGLLLLDGLHRLAGRLRTQVELARVCEEMVRRGAQVVIASDRTPQEIEGLDAALGRVIAGGLMVDVAPLAEDGGPAGAGVGEAAGEFGSFLTDISAAVASVVEAAPWRRRLGEAILRWEADGVHVGRLTAALEADSAPDVEALLAGFRRDVERLRAAAAGLRALGVPLPDAELLRDPARVVEAEALLARHRPVPVPPAPAPAAAPAAPLDEWFFDGERFDWGWIALDDRVLEEG